MTLATMLRPRATISEAHARAAVFCRNRGVLELTEFSDSLRRHVPPDTLDRALGLLQTRHEPLSLSYEVAFIRYLSRVVTTEQWDAAVKAMEGSR